MSRCQIADDCPFFNDSVGFSPDLNVAMRERFCLGANSACARLAALDHMRRDEVPVDLLPTDTERLAQILAARQS